MGLSDVVSRVVELIGAAAIVLRRQDGRTLAPATGDNPSIPPAKAQGIPTLKMPTAKGWTQGQTPNAAPGLEVNRLRPISSILDGSTCCRMATCSWPRR